MFPRGSAAAQAGKQFFKTKERLRHFKHRRLAGSQNCLSGIILNKASRLALGPSVCRSYNSDKFPLLREKALRAEGAGIFANSMQILLHKPAT